MRREREIDETKVFKLFELERERETNPVSERVRVSLRFKLDDQSNR